MISLRRALVLALVLALLAVLPRPAQSAAAGLAPETQTAIEAIVAKTLAETGAPGASIAVVKDKVLFAKAFGDARVRPKIPATAEMRYKIASNSKQIAATAILLLAEQRKVSLDDTVAR